MAIIMADLVNVVGISIWRAILEDPSLRNFALYWVPPMMTVYGAVQRTKHNARAPNSKTNFEGFTLLMKDDILI
jgi:hypothetical protein